MTDLETCEWKVIIGEKEYTIYPVYADSEYGEDTEYYNIVARCDSESKDHVYFCNRISQSFEMNQEFLDLLDDAFNEKQGMHVTAEISKCGGLDIKIYHKILKYLGKKYLELSFVKE